LTLHYSSHVACGDGGGRDADDAHRAATTKDGIQLAAYDYSFAVN
jgi:hypothetical protein